MPRPAWRALGAVLLGAALYFYGSTSEVAWLFLIAYWTWALVVAALIYVAWARRGLDVDLALSARPDEQSPARWLPESLLRAAPAPCIFEGDALSVGARLRSLGAARGPVRLRATVRGRPLELAVGRVGRGGAEVAAAHPNGGRGRVALQAARLRVDDPAGLFWSEDRLPDRELGLVLPRLSELARDRRLDEVEDATSSPRSGSGTELFGVREYRPGDSLRRIHWRLSARRPPGALVVREYEPPGLRTLLVVVDPDPVGGAADQAARIAASEAWDCLREGGRAVLWAAGKQSSGETADLWTLLHWLARWPDLPADDAGPPAAGEAVAVTTDGSALEALELARRRGRSARAWAVGMSEPPPADVPCRSVGLEWPL